MMKRMLMLSVLAFAALCLGACGGKPLLSAPMPNMKDVEGSYTLIYYMGTQRTDFTNLVILDLEGDGYRFIPEVKDYEYEILQNVSISEAIYETNVFYARNRFIESAEFFALLSPDGKKNIIGYEIRPLYDPALYGAQDIMDMYYEMGRNKRIKLEIKLKSVLKRMMKPGTAPVPTPATDKK